MTNILALTDFSHVSNYAIEAALTLAKRHGAQLKILHVMTGSSRMIYDLDSDPELIIKTRKDRQINAKIDSWKDMAVAANISAQLIIASGDLTKAAERTIAEHSIDLVIMGSTGIDGNDALWGSSTQMIVRSIKTPVLVIKSPTEQLKIDHMVFATDLDTEDRQVLKDALQLLQPPHTAVIHLVTIDTAGFFAQPRAVMQLALKEFAALAEPYTTTQAFYSDYSIEAGVKHYLQDVDADVLVMSNRKRNVLKDLFMPSAAMQALRDVACPVLIVNS